jgi:type VI protein secretion system component VasK
MLDRLPLAVLVIVVALAVGLLTWGRIENTHHIATLNHRVDVLQTQIDALQRRLPQP